jgi:hypothetical protein
MERFDCQHRIRGQCGSVEFGMIDEDLFRVRLRSLRGRSREVREQIIQRGSASDRRG